MSEKIAHVYKLTHLPSGDFFVGATTQSLNRRRNQLKTQAADDLGKFKLNPLIRSEPHKNFQIKAIATAVVQNYEDLFILENGWIERLRPKLNEPVRS